MNIGNEKDVKNDSKIPNQDFWQYVWENKL